MKLDLLFALALLVGTSGLWLGPKSFPTIVRQNLYHSFSASSVLGREPGSRLYATETTDAAVITANASKGPETVAPRVYKPKADGKFANSYSRPPPGGGGGSKYPNQGGGRSSSGSSSSSSSRSSPSSSSGNNVVLSAPQLLIRFKVPKVKSDFKKELEDLQATFLAQTEQMRPQRDNDGGGGRDAFFDNFAPSSDSSSGGDFKKGGPGAFKKGAKEDRRPEGRPKAQTSRRGGTEVDEEEESYEERVGEDESGGNGDADYYGDEENVSLNSISAGVLANMQLLGYSFEEIQMSLYAEYGVKASVQAIRRRLQDDKFRKNKKKTGKTRKDRTKARNARFNPVAVRKVVLPESGYIQVQALAELLDLGAGEVIKHLMLNEGIMVTMTQNLDVEVARRVTIAFGKPLAGDDDDEEDDDEDEPVNRNELLQQQAEAEAKASGKELLPRAPVVTIMGHVDHGKTTLLDRIRSAQVAQAEAGGITQAISAFKVVTPNDNTVTFFDTPGHSAFSEMRQRGANVTDVVVLVVAADDGVMDQTKECIAAAKAAGCPIVVAINKMDKEGADPSRVKTELMSYDVLLEEFGGECQCVEISAKTGSGIDELLEKILLQSDVLNLKAVVDAPAAGSVIEARVDKGLGVVVTALVQKGTLSVGDLVLAGPSWGRVRRLVNDQGIQVQSVGPSTPVQIVGMNGVPGAGDQLSIATSEADAKDVADARQRLNKMAVGSASKSAIMAMASGFAGGGADTREVIKIPIVIKGDVLGSVQAIRSAIEALQESDDEAVCKADIVYSSVGDVTSSDVAIAAAAKARIVAFNVASGFNAMEEARSNNVDIGYYSVIYELLEQMKTQIQTTLAPPPPGTLLGRLEIKKVFKLGRAGKVAGCEVTEGIVRMDSKVRVLRGKRNVIYSGSIASIKVVKDDVREVPIGSECGVSLTDYSDFEEGDILECFSIGQTDA